MYMGAYIYIYIYNIDTALREFRNTVDVELVELGINQSPPVVFLIHKLMGNGIWTEGEEAERIGGIHQDQQKCLRLRFGMERNDRVFCIVK